MYGTSKKGVLYVIQERVCGGHSLPYNRVFYGALYKMFSWRVLVGGFLGAFIFKVCSRSRYLDILSVLVH